MVKLLHAAGLEVILDVVYNHTAEGNRVGPTLSFKGIDHAAYYRLSDQDRRYCHDVTGTGNTFKTHSPVAMRLIVDSLRYWVEQMHVDGFRFDLATAFGRGAHHQFDLHGRFFSSVRRDTVRDVWLGPSPSFGPLAAALAGSHDTFAPSGRGPGASINLLTVPDGFTLKRNLLARLFLSQGTPLLPAGDEISRSQGGSNNGYCRDGPISWTHWAPDERRERLLAFCRHLIALRAAHPVLRREHGFDGYTHREGCKDLRWLGADGRDLSPEDWQRPALMTVAMLLCGWAEAEDRIEAEPKPDEASAALGDAESPAWAAETPSAAPEAVEGTAAVVMSDGDLQAADVAVLEQPPTAAAEPAAEATSSVVDGPADTTLEAVPVPPAAPPAPPARPVGDSLLVLVIRQSDAAWFTLPALPAGRGDAWWPLIDTTTPDGLPRQPGSPWRERCRVGGRALVVLRQPPG